MAYDPLSQSPLIPVETPSTENATVDLSSDFSSINPSSTKPLTIPNEANDLSRDDIIDWFQKIQTALKYRRNHWNGIDSWYRFKRLYAGYHLNQWKRSSNLSFITVNTAYSVIRSIFPELYFKDPYFYISPSKDGEEYQASLTEHIFNQEWKKKIKGKRALRRNILDYGIFGWSVSKIGYRFLTDVARNLAKDGEIDFERYHQLEEVFVSRVSPFNFIWDFVEASHPDDSQWLAEVRIRPYRDVQADSRYKNTDDIKTSAMPRIGISSLETDSTRYYGSFVSQSLSENDKLNSQYVFEWIITDLKFRKQITLAEGNEDSALRMIDLPFDRVLYKYLFLDEVPDEPFPLSPLGTVEDQILERDYIRTNQFRNWRRFTRKYKARKGAIDSAELTKLRRGDDGTIVQLKNMDDLDVIQDPEMKQEVLLAESAAKSDIVEIIGISGGGSAGNATKDRQNAVIDTLRSADHRSIVSEFLIDIAYDAIAIMRQEYSFDRVVKISGQNLGQFWVTYSKDDLAEDPCIEVDVGEMVPEDPALQRKQMIDLYLSLRGDPNINGRELLRRILSSFPGMRDVDQLFMQDTLYQNPIFQLIQRQAQGYKSGGMSPPELLRLLRTLMAQSNMMGGPPPAQVAPSSGMAPGNAPTLQAATPGNILRQPPIRPNSAEGNISNLRNRGVNY